MKTIRVTVRGLVQGVGFRPFVYRVAMDCGLTGWVNNTNEDVRIAVTGDPSGLERFLSNLSSGAPVAAVVEEVLAEPAELTLFDDFRILGSDDVSSEITEVSPDIAVCDECLADMDRPGPRFGYAFVNCTNCGPRFTIIRDLPYDRKNTTMQPFTMCPGCRREYENVIDRRFHAQPTACDRCGPQYTLYGGASPPGGDFHEIVRLAATAIGNGEVVLVKGLGGMHLACDAFSEPAVAKLREVKKRDSKPFAVMFRDTESLALYVRMDKTEEQSLKSWRRPIVLLRSSGEVLQPGLSKGIGAGLNTVGAMLPYLPFHHLLFRQLETRAIVLTSGNFSSEPILTGNREALEQFTSVAGSILLHNRDIYNRTDDSVVRIMDGKERVFRRSRGYVPAPVRTDLDTEGIIAFGAELTNCFCVGKGRKAFLSQHIGDLQGVETTLFYEETLSRFINLFRVKPALLVTDMHPDYISTKTAEKFPGLPVIRVQHHHAHIASCMAEHRLDEKVIGVALDGTGYGDDGHNWGGEFMVCDLAGYRRITHFDYIPMPGGDRASEEPWRMCVSWLYRVFGNGFRELDLPLFRQMDQEKTEAIVRMIDRKINCPLTSGAGRLFDAVSSLTGLCQAASFQAEGPMRLEAAIEYGILDLYPFSANGPIRFDETIRCMVTDMLAGVPVGVISARFHNTLVSVIFETSKAIRGSEGISKVMLSGGVFQNKYLLEKTAELLRTNGFEVFIHASVPANDGGLALGQLAIASKRREQKCV